MPVRIAFPCPGLMTPACSLTVVATVVAVSTAAQAGSIKAAARIRPALHPFVIMACLLPGGA